MDFWQSINKGLDLIEERKPATFVELAAILREHCNPDNDSIAGGVFFGGSGGERQLRRSLVKAGWRVIASEAPYYYVALAPSGDMLQYVEGDVERVTWRAERLHDLVKRVSA